LPFGERTYFVEILGRAEDGDSFEKEREREREGFQQILRRRLMKRRDKRRKVGIDEIDA